MGKIIKITLSNKTLKLDTLLGRTEMWTIEKKTNNLIVCYALYEHMKIINVKI